MYLGVGVFAVGCVVLRLIGVCYSRVLPPGPREVGGGLGGCLEALRIFGSFCLYCGADRYRSEHPSLSKLRVGLFTGFTSATLIFGFVVPGHVSLWKVRDGSWIRSRMTRLGGWCFPELLLAIPGHGRW